MLGFFQVASTTWQLLLLRLNGFKQNFTKELLKQWDYSEIPNLHFRRYAVTKRKLMIVEICFLSLFLPKNLQKSCG